MHEITRLPGVRLGLYSLLLFLMFWYHVPVKNIYREAASEFVCRTYTRPEITDTQVLLQLLAAHRRRKILIMGGVKGEQGSEYWGGGGGGGGKGAGQTFRWL